MKRGEMAIYKILDRKPMYNNQQYNSQVKKLFRASAKSFAQVDHDLHVISFD